VVSESIIDPTPIALAPAAAPAEPDPLQDLIERAKRGAPSDATEQTPVLRFPGGDPFVPTPLPSSEPRDTLPANPFGDLSPEALEAFIDCTLFEEVGASDLPPTPPPGAAEPPVADSVSVPIPGSRWRIQLAAGLLGALLTCVGLGAGYLVWGGRPAAVERTSKIAEELQKPVAAPPAPARCSADIVSDPLGATVVWGDARLGSTPALDVTVPCGEAQVSLEYAGYRTVGTRVAATSKAPTVLFEHLVRSASRVKVDSTPPGAHVSVDGKVVGDAPLAVDLTPGDQVVVRAWLHGFRGWSKKVRASESEMDLHIALRRAKEEFH
jgi:hypothetical protein